MNITIDEEVHRKAHEIGLNVSKVCENALREAIRRLTQPKTETNGGSPFLSEGSFGKESSLVGLPGFEPGSREPKSPSLDHASRQPL